MENALALESGPMQWGPYSLKTLRPKISCYCPARLTSGYVLTISVKMRNVMFLIFEALSQKSIETDIFGEVRSHQKETIIEARKFINLFRRK